MSPRGEHATPVSTGERGTDAMAVTHTVASDRGSSMPNGTSRRTLRRGVAPASHLRADGNTTPPPRVVSIEHARANGFEHHGRRSPRHGRLARAARQRVCAHSLSTQSSRPAAPSALAARQLPGSRRQSSARQTNLHLVVDAHARSSPAARHGLSIRHELASDAASGRIGRC